MVLLKKAVVFAAVTVSVAGLAGGPAASALGADTAFVVGSGTVTPGIPGPLAPCVSNEHVTFDGTLAIAGDDAQLPASVHFEGDSTRCESSFLGAGDGVLYGAAAGNVHYERQYKVVLITAPTGLVINGSTHTLVNATCDYTPTSLNPTTSYTLVCHAVLTD